MNGLTRRLSERNQLQIGEVLLTALGGILLGFFVLLVFQLPMKFTYYLIAGPIILFIAISTGHFKRFFQGVMIFIIPINLATHFFRRPYEFGVGGLAFAPLDIVLILLYFIWLYELLLKRSGHFHFFPKITVPALCLVGISALSMLPAHDPYLALFETTRIFRAVLLYFYVANHFLSKRDISFVLVLIIGGLFLQSMLAFAQKWLELPVGLQLFGEWKQLGSHVFGGEYQKIARVGGTIGHANSLAKYVVLLIPLSVTLLFSKIRLKYKLANCLIGICAFIVLLLTLSRGAWICFLGSMALLFLIIFRARLMNLQTFVALAAVAVIFIGIGLSFSTMIQGRLFGEDYGSARGRIPLNRVALNVIRAHPFLGVGVKNYGKIMHLYDTNLETMEVNLVHNVYLLKAAEMGIGGLIIFLWLLISMFQQGLRNLKVKDSFLVCLNSGCLAGMAALWAQWLVTYDYLANWGMLWVLAGLVVASGKIGSERQVAAANEEKARPEERNPGSCWA